MHAIAKGLGIGLGLVALSGCPDDRWFCIVARETWAWPDEVSPETEALLAEPLERFSAADHPLRDVVVGTVMDDLSGLDGCWGWRTVETVDDPNTGQPTEVETATVMEFDLAAGLLTYHYYLISPGLLVTQCDDQICPTYILGDAVGMFESDWKTLTIVDDNSLAAEAVDGWGGAIDPDGHLGFDCRVAVGIAMNATTSLDLFVTLQGDYLKTIDLLDREDYVPDVEGDLWVRFDCPPGN